ncbi:hypothetical protein [Uliginosibacterium gangwonense]|uniref:hypothetical protein n=1 Tax=Uliginosibacterium gangwonense TaxID=392736 RepID=UPI0003AAF702|nr:hypothetical protein [Uliginosibacterium gangwonense]
MAKINGIENMTVAQLNEELAKGGKFVVFDYCISVVVMSFKRSSDVYFVKAGEGSFKHGISFTLMTLFLGWWGFPWGLIYSIGALGTNLGGGRNVTQEVLAALNS